MELHQGRITLGVDEPEGVNAGSLRGPVGAGDPTVAHHPQQVTGGLGVLAEERDGSTESNYVRARPVVRRPPAGPRPKVEG